MSWGNCTSLSAFRCRSRLSKANMARLCCALNGSDLSVERHKSPCTKRRLERPCTNHKLACFNLAHTICWSGGDGCFGRYGCFVPQLGCCRFGCYCAFCQLCCPQFELRYSSCVDLFRPYESTCSALLSPCMSGFSGWKLHVHPRRMSEISAHHIQGLLLGGQRTSHDLDAQDPFASSVPMRFASADPFSSV